LSLGDLSLEEPLLQPEGYVDHAGHRRHSFNSAAQTHHAQRIDVIRDCDVLLASGMGAGAYESTRQAGIKPVVTDVETIDEVVQF
jgi:predicted Fe-Mo cluster-binding NifX family protein